MKANPPGERRSTPCHGVSSADPVIGIPCVRNKGSAVNTQKTGKSRNRDPMGSLRNKTGSDCVLGTRPDPPVLCVEISGIFAMDSRYAKADRLRNTAPRRAGAEPLSVPFGASTPGRWLIFPLADTCAEGRTDNSFKSKYVASIYVSTFSKRQVVLIADGGTDSCCNCGCVGGRCIRKCILWLRLLGNNGQRETTK